MAKRILLPVIFLILAWGFASSGEFTEIAAGVAIFLFGMLALEEGFKAFTGGVLEKVLHNSTNRLWKSLGFGIVTTTVMQSSSLVSVITISFLSAGLIALAPGIGIIFGSNLGTTTGAWLVAGVGLKVDIAAYAMPMIVFGVVLLFQNSKLTKGSGYILAGIGFLFLGIHYMKNGFETFQDSIDLAQFAIAGYGGVLVYTLIGIAATVVMQSSHATLILSITALAAGQITYENSLALAIGSNVGTTVTAVLGAMGANVAGKRLAAAHFIFNAITGLIAIVFIFQLAEVVDLLSRSLGIAADNLTLKFAVFHTLFNVIGVTLMTPLIGGMVTFLERVLPEPVQDNSKPQFLNEATLEFPDTALKAIINECQHFFGNAYNYLARGLGVEEADLRSDKDLDQVMASARLDPDLDLEDLYERRIKELYSAIVDFAARAERDMVPEQVELLYHIKVAIRDIVQALKTMKHLHSNLVRYSTAENADIRAEYAKLSLAIAQVLRTIDRTKEDATQTLATLRQQRKTVKAYDIVEQGAFQALIRENRISARMATSLINDTSYAKSIIAKLIKAARSLLEDKSYDLYRALAETPKAAEEEESLPGDDAPDTLSQGRSE